MRLTAFINVSAVVTSFTRWSSAAWSGCLCLQNQMTLLSLYSHTDRTNFYNSGNFYKVIFKIMHRSVIYTKGHACKHKLFHGLVNQLNYEGANAVQSLKKCSTLEGFYNYYFYVMTRPNMSFWILVWFAETGSWLPVGMWVVGQLWNFSVITFHVDSTETKPNPGNKHKCANKFTICIFPALRGISDYPLCCYLDSHSRCCV
jgi:hypothetical protein